MKKSQTPGVHAVEMSAFPNTVVPVSTSVVAFLGYTERASKGLQGLRMVPTPVRTLAEFERLFGGAPPGHFELVVEDDASHSAAIVLAGKPHRLVRAGGHFGLYSAVQQFFSHSGGLCYVVSVGEYAEPLEAGRFIDGLDALLREPEPALVVVPEAVRLPEPECIEVQRAMLVHCGGQSGSRFAVLDLWGGHAPRDAPEGDPVSRFRARIGHEFLSFGAAYYPWLDTRPSDAEQSATLGAESIGPVGVLESLSPTEREAVLRLAERELRRHPPSAAIAAVYSLVDGQIGVWRAPANASLPGDVAPSVAIRPEWQGDLNTPDDGKAVNAIREFPGTGLLVYGARTLDGHSVDGRYIAVRRTEIMLNASIQGAILACVFEPNAAKTWSSIRDMLRAFLSSVWKQGGLVGATPEDAFFVRCGLGETMTDDDVCAGRLRVEVGVALQNPGEFTVLVHSQVMAPALTV
jgi:hypothetical protein